MKRGIPVLLAALVLPLGAAAAAPTATNVWTAAEARTLSFEFRFLHPKGQVTVTRACDVKQPRTRITASVSLLPHCFRSGVWDAEKGRGLWRGSQTNVGSFGYEGSLETNVWHRARVVQRENAMALLVHWRGVWRETAFCRYDWDTTASALSAQPGWSEVRNVTSAPAEGRARLLDVSPEGKDVVASFATGPGKALLRVCHADGSERWSYLWPDAETLWCTRRKEKGGEDWYARVCRDGMLRLSEPSLKIFAPARVWSRRPADRAGAIDYAESHPEACAPNRRVTFRFAVDRSVWLDGKYLGAVTNEIRSVSLYVPEVAPAGERLERVDPLPQTDTLTLDPADCVGAKRSDDGRAYLDISEHREHSDPGQETDHYFDRDGFDGFADSFVWSVPNRCWATARLVAGVTPEADAKSVPIVTVRLAHNSFAGYGDACAEGQVNLEKAPRVPAGTATVGGRKVPLYAYEVKIPVGDIQDRLYVKRGQTPLGKLPFLHLDVVGPLGRPGILWDKSHKPDWRTRSSALVFGLSLVESPCEMELLQSQPGLVFADDERRETMVRLKANRAGAYALAAEIRDWDGKVVKTASEKLTLAAGEERRVTLDLAMGAEGWFALDLALSDGAGTRLTHRAAFADVGRDTRQAGYESPYSFWWTGAHHGGTADIDTMGPILKKMGVRRVSAIDGQHTEASMGKYGLTLSQIPFNINLAMSALSKRPIPEMVAEYEKWIRKILADFPHVERRALVFHESYCGGHPHYLWDGPDRAWTEADFAQAKPRFELGVALCRMIREKFPEIRIQLGNSSSSYEILDVMFRLGFPKELFDRLGSETVARFVMPDLPIPSSGPSSLVYLNQVAEHYGYPQRADVCYEWVSHLPRELTPTEVAEWSVRDVLLAFAAGATMVPVGGTTPDDCYFNSDYGGIASVDRFPYLYPTRAYVAKALLTRELDCATFARRLPTGSQTVNALEFRRANGECVYAMWLPRGTATVRLVGTGLFGREKAVSPVRAVRIDAHRPTSLTLSRRPLFVTTKDPLARAEIVSRETPPEVAPRRFQLASALADAADVAVANPDDWICRRLNDDKYRTNGVFRVTGGGGCVALTRDATRPLHRNLSEFAYLRLARPVVLAGEPASLSVEVDGNSSWAEVLFCVEDAEGKLFSPTGVWYEGDARAHGRVNFDGWGTLQFPFSTASRVKTSEVDARGGFWRCDARGRKGASEGIVYPIKIVGFAVSMPRQTISGGVQEPVARNPDVLRFRNLGAFE